MPRQDSDLGATVRWANGTPGTSIAANVQTTFNVNSALLCIQNKETASGPRIVRPRFFSMIVTVADTGGTAMHIYGVVDNSLRYNAGGFQPISPEWGFTRPDLIAAGVVPISEVHVGALNVLNASASHQNVNRALVKIAAAAPLFVVGDVIDFVFDDPIGQPGGVIQNTVPSRYTVYLGQVSLSPQSSYVLHMWMPGVTVAFQFEHEGELLELM